MSTLVTRRGAAVLGTAGALLLAVLAIAPEAGAATLYACVKKDGTAHVFSKKPKCKKHETKLSWNTTGPAGRDGTNGIGGGAGKEGSAGKEGARGPGGPAGQPEFVNTFSVPSAAPGSGTPLFTLANVAVKLGCAAGVSSLEATGPEKTQAESGMVDSLATNMEAAFQRNVYNVPLGTSPVFGVLATDASEATVGHINATIMTPTAVVFIDAFIGTTTSVCTVSGTVFDIPIV